MGVDQYFTQEWKPISTAGANFEETSVCFDCNICLDFAHDPVVTLCGHLYCWPCIYKWCYVQSASLASDENPQCPVCKAEISHSTVVPLYGRGHSPSAAENESKPRQLGILIPPRPSAYGSHLMSTYNTAHQFPYHNNYQNQQEPPHSIDRNEEDSSHPLFNLWGSAAGMFHPVMGMFGEMVYARTFGNSESLYSYPNSYHSAGRSSTRLRRQELQADKSLNRISIFLFCCFLLCLLLF